jgi:hypothetical protein
MQDVKTYPLSSIMEKEDQKEAHYWFTVLSIVELMNEHGQLKVLMDITSCLAKQEETK